MRFLKTLFNRSTNTSRLTLNKRTLNKRTKLLSLESLEQRIALDASGVRSQLEPVREVYIDDSLVGPTPIVFGKSELIGQDTNSFIVTSVAAGSTVEKWDTAGNQWVDVSAPVKTSHPSELIRLMRLRVIQEGDQVRWIPKSVDGILQKAFGIIGWDDSSETTVPEGVNLPGAVENLEIDIVGDQVQVTWDPPTTGEAVTNYALDQQLDLVTVVPSTQTIHTFAKTASQASYAVTVHANSSAGAGEATTVMLSTGSYVGLDGTVIDPIRDTSGNVLNYDGPNLKPGNEFGNMTNLKNVVLRNADLTNADLINADLTGADLTGANMTAAILNGAVLTDAILTGVNLDVAAFGVPVILSGVRSGGITGLVDQLPPRWRLTGGYLIGPGANLTGADLSYVDLSDTFLNGANLTNVNLSYATLTGSGADLTGTTLTGVQSGSINSSQLILPPGWQLVVGYIIGPGANLTGANLMDADLTNVNLTGADLTGAHLDGATLTGAHLDGATLTGADLEGATLTGATLTGVISGGITGPPASLPTDWKLVDGYLIGPFADLTGATLTGAELSNTNLFGANLNSAILTGANLTGAVLTNADLPGATLTGATLTEVYSGGITGPPASLPTDWQLINGYLIGPFADLSGADLTGVDLADADLTGAILSAVQSGSVTFTGTLPMDWQLINGYLVGPYADLTNADLTDVNLANANLRGVSSGGITFTGTAPTLPTDWQLNNGYLIGPYADLIDATLPDANLTNADLTGADLTGASLTNTVLDQATLTATTLTNADLTGADLTGAHLDGATLTGATLTGVISGGITGPPASLPTDWRFVDGYLIGPYADLTGATLTGADLTWPTNLSGANLNRATLTGANLTGAALTNANLLGATLTGATLTEVQSGGITGPPASLPTDWHFINGFLIGPFAQLSGEDLAGLDLADTDLTGAILTYANLDQATLTATTLTNANLTGATLTGVTGAAKYNSATILPAGFDPVAAGWTLIS